MECALRKVAEGWGMAPRPGREQQIRTLEAMLEITDRLVYLARLLDWARERRALYLHAVEREPFRVRVGSRLEAVPVAIFPELNREEIQAGLAEFFGEELRYRLETETESDLIFTYQDYRYRAHFGRQQERMYFSIRAVPRQMFRLKDLQLPVSIGKLKQDPHGFVLFAGPTGHGKGNSARAALQELVDAMELRVITVEDPVKYVIPAGRSQVLQREVGIDVDSTAAGLRSALRENPDVIFVNELADHESIDLALRAADRGVLVMAITTARSTADAIDRLRERFDAGQQANFDARFARCLNAICFQRMVPNLAQGRTPCVEICRWSREIGRCIAGYELVKLTANIEASIEAGMHSYDQYLIELHIAGVIARRTVRDYCLNRTYVDRYLERTKPVAGGEA